MGGKGSKVPGGAFLAIRERNPDGFCFDVNGPMRFKDIYYKACAPFIRCLYSIACIVSYHILLIMLLYMLRVISSWFYVQYAITIHTPRSSEGLQTDVLSFCFTFNWRHRANTAGVARWGNRSRSTALQMEGLLGLYRVIQFILCKINSLIIQYYT